MGVDVGSVSGKAVLMTEGNIVAWQVLPTGPDSRRTALDVANAVLQRSGAGIDDVAVIVGTGYGRSVIPFADKEISEITCHARGCHYFNPAVRTILDMGGQDCKAMSCDQSGKVLKFVMNDKCAAGVGRSMGIMADLFDIDLCELSSLALAASHDPFELNSTCAVFSRSEAIAAIRNGISRERVLAGACKALASRVQRLVARVGVKDAFMISGGIAKNVAVVANINSALGVDAHICHEPQIVGAVGAALFAQALARSSDDALGRDRRTDSTLMAQLYQAPAPQRKADGCRISGDI